MNSLCPPHRDCFLGRREEGGSHWGRPPYFRGTKGGSREGGTGRCFTPIGPQDTREETEPTKKKTRGDTGRKGWSRGGRSGDQRTKRKTSFVTPGKKKRETHETHSSLRHLRIAGWVQQEATCWGEKGEPALRRRAPYVFPRGGRCPRKKGRNARGGKIKKKENPSYIQDANGGKSPLRPVFDSEIVTKTGKGGERDKPQRVT